ncbi:site-specific integrase [Streptomyces cyaneochromogenes]|uniref:Site-specific integrase n=1 Tax=Streptomyces cyaneochromogenes TaxID=2496836 RepID=A0A3S9M9P9_9ACTN|nr:site-specific integrase [Streptomyces cyaneochromogenes]AZQ35947.1 site-specific integrase [Streptomyces cyaneochromogenes]
MKPYKACSCRDPETKRLLGKKCSDLPKKGHGGWYARYEAPPSAEGKRRQPRIGPYTTETECKKELAKVLGTAASPKAHDERKTTLGEYLERRYAWRVSEAETGEGLKKGTLDAEREAIDLYGKPGLGHIKVVDLTDEHFRELYAAMRKINRPEEQGDRSEILRRLKDARATRGGRRVHTRPIGESRIRRVHAVLHGALTDAVKLSKIRPDNPADGVWRTKGGKRKPGRAKPLLWTDERVEQWLRTGVVPAKVMVWTAAQTGNFLDFADACEERLYPAFHLDAYYGPRRGELVAAEEQSLSLERARLHILQSQSDDELDDTKTEAGWRQVPLDPETVRVHRAWHKRKLEERLRWGELYQDSGRVYCYEDGTALKAEYLSSRFRILIERHKNLRDGVREKGWSVERAARHYRTTVAAVEVALLMPLPPIRLHDLRHGAATMLLAAGVDDKFVSEVLGHASVSFTKDVYAVVAEEMAADATRRIAAFIPRQNRLSAVGAISVPSGG